MLGCDNPLSDVRGWVLLNGVKFTSGLDCVCPGPVVVLIVSRGLLRNSFQTLPSHSPGVLAGESPLCLLTIQYVTSSP